MEKKPAIKKSSPRGTNIPTASIAAGVAGVLLAVWLLYGTATIDPFRWGVFVEELIVALCALFALRLLCVIRLPKWVSVASVALVFFGVSLYGALSLPDDTAVFLRALCLAFSAVFALLIAWQLDTKPDGVLLAALLSLACMPALFGAQTRLLDEIARAMILAGVFLTVLSVRQKTISFAYLAVALFALAGASGLFAAFAGLGAGIGALLLAPKRTRRGWVFAAILMAALPVAVRFLAVPLLPAGGLLVAGNPAPLGAFALLTRTHLLRALALGLILLSIRFFLRREDAGVPVVLALAGCAAARLLPFVSAPDVWMDALLLCALAGVGVAKVARAQGR